MESPEFDAIVAYVMRAPNGATIDEIAANAVPSIPRRTLQRWLASLVENRALRTSGAARSTRYFASRKSAPAAPPKSPEAAPTRAPAAARPAPQPPQSAPRPAPLSRPEPAPAPSIPAPPPPPRMRRRTRSREMQERFDEALPRALQRIMLTSLGPDEVTSMLRNLSLTLIRGTTEDRADFIAYTIEALRGLTDENRARYDIGPATYAEWREQSARRAARLAACRTSPAGC